MKYANYYFNARSVNNLGDNMQIIAIDNLYKKMGIDLDDVVYINTHDLATYDGEYVILPVTMPLVDYCEGGIAKRFSDKIIPAFLGLTMVKESLEWQEVEYLHHYEPIGCRDERTLSTLRKYGVLAYLNGCITLTLSDTQVYENSIFEEKVPYIVDIDAQFEKYIPKYILDKAERCSHFRRDVPNPKEVAKAQYLEYQQRASVIITSLLHCAVPCIAAGIPVIILKKSVSYRMAWLEKIIPVYTEDNVTDITWDVKPPDIQMIKNKIESNAIQVLHNIYDKYSCMYDISWYYEERNKSEYINDACESLKIFVDSNWADREYSYNFSIWGMTQISEWIVDYIFDRYPNAKLCHVYDGYRKIKFRGIDSEKPENIRNNINEFVFVTTNGAEVAAKKLFSEIKKPQNTYAFMQVIM